MSGTADGICPSSCESQGVGGINHTLRVHGHTILHEEEAAKTLNNAGQRSLERRIPGFTEDSTEQAAPSASQSGIAYKKSVDVAQPAHLGTNQTDDITVLFLHKTA